MASRGRSWDGQSMLEQDPQRVLEFIATEGRVTIELLFEQFPGFRWGDLLSLLGAFRQEGLVTVHQVEGVLSVRITAIGEQEKVTPRSKVLRSSNHGFLYQHLTRS